MRSLLYAVLLVVLAALGAVAWRSGGSVRDTTIQAEQYEAATAWPVLQARVELERFRLALARHVAGEPGVSYDDVLLRFDLLWSRIPLLDTEVVLPIEVDGLTVKDVKAEARQVLATVDALLQARTDARRDLARLSKVADALEPLAEKLQRLLVAFQVERHRLYVETRHGILMLGRRHTATIIGFFGVAVVLLILALTETKTARRAEQRFRHFATSASDWLWEMDAGLRLSFVSERWRDIFGLPELTILGRRWTSLTERTVRSVEWQQHLEDLAARRSFRNITCTLEAAGGALRTVQVSGVPVFNARGAFRGYRGIGTDITERLAQERRIQYLAAHDPLTGLFNRAAIQERLADALESARDNGTQLALLVLDLDGFKEVNDTFGHDIGDRVLSEVAGRLLSAVRKSDLIARLGGDEFMLVLGSRHATTEEAERAAERLVQAIGSAFVIDGQELRIGTSVGVALFPKHGPTAEALLKAADLALYRAKEEGRGTFRLFQPDMNARLQARKALERDLRRALPRGDFEVHYQPKMSADDGRMLGVEALVRWRHPERGLVSPGEFVPLAEETGVILPLGEWVLRTACAQATAWPGVQMSVNLSPVQFKHADLVGLVDRVLEEAGLEPQRLELEITEGVLLRDTVASLNTLRRLKGLGVKLAMDDFGTGYSSLSYLQSFPFDKIKIDQQFVRRLGTSASADAEAIVRAVLGLGHSLGMLTNAEGVETAEQLAFLRAEGCDEVQGYYFSRPVPPAEIERLLPGKGGAAGRVVRLVTGAATHAVEGCAAPRTRGSRRFIGPAAAPQPVADPFAASRMRHADDRREA